MVNFTLLIVSIAKFLKKLCNLVPSNFLMFYNSCGENVTLYQLSESSYQELPIPLRDSSPLASIIIVHTWKMASN